MIVGLVFITVMYLFYSMMEFEIYRSQFWPTVPGLMLVSKYQKVVPSTKRRYEIEVQFQYKIGDKEYHSNQLQIGGYVTRDRTKAKSIVEKFAVGKTVPVYYNPENPKTAYILVGLDTTGKIIFVWFTFLTVLSWFLFLRSLLKDWRIKRGKLVTKRGQICSVEKVDLPRN